MQRSISLVTKEEPPPGNRRAAIFQVLAAPPQKRRTIEAVSDKHPQYQPPYKTNAASILGKTKR
jgi:hypothetical protein